MTTDQSCIDAYKKHQNLKIAAMEVGVSWQNLYVRLVRNGIPVIGNKEKYGSEKDKLAAKSEKDFLKYVPSAKDCNKEKFQSKIDFSVRELSVDVKASTLRRSNKKCKTRRWAFSIKKQEIIADYFVLFAYDDNMKIKHCFLLPGEIVRKMSTISISEAGGKWMDFKIEPEELDSFFSDVSLHH
ncbi:hypothetical protein [Sessilibacter corallicola]|uniref:hypothetical protein n=1 Tax=Sessilibacter corallicola TaxID=2904075 RepID=UPI001E2E3427|nr:hypothetical protein [Sessilibacter corallicola]MCE2029244.1 hypothetical protein [Sessilibacter corallicola]